MGGKRLRVNVDKAKGMQLLFGKKSSVSKVDPCGICNERVGCNSIQCVESQMWDYPSSSSFFFFFFFDVPWHVESIISGCLCRTCRT